MASLSFAKKFQISVSLKYSFSKSHLLKSGGSDFSPRKHGIAPYPEKQVYACLRTSASSSSSPQASAGPSVVLFQRGDFEGKQQVCLGSKAGLFIVQSFPIAAATNYHRVSTCTHRFIPSQFWESEV